MRIIRCTRPGAVDQLADLIDNPDYPKAAWAETVKTWLRDGGDSVLLLVAVAEEEPYPVTAILLALAEPETDYAFVYQSWASPETRQTDVPDQMFFRCCQWAEGQGKKHIRMETERDPRGLQRRWRFEVRSHIMQFAIPDSYRAFADTGRRADLIGATEEPDGKQQQPAEVVQHPDAGPEGGVVGTGPNDPGGDADGGDPKPAKRRRKP